MAEADKGKAKGKGKGNEKELEMEDNSDTKKKKLIIIGAAVAGVLLLGGLGGYFLFGSGDSGDVTQEATLNDDASSDVPKEEKASAGVSVGSALYVAMPRPFVFNVPGSVRDRLVQIKVQLLVRGDDSEEQAKRHIPLIEGALLRTFTSTNADTLATTSGKEALKSKSLQDVQATMVDITGKKIVERVLFTGFVMQ
jgi:flagellar FliL protein